VGVFQQQLKIDPTVFSADSIPSTAYKLMDQHVVVVFILMMSRIFLQGRDLSVQRPHMGLMPGKLSRQTFAAFSSSTVCSSHRLLVSVQFIIFMVSHWLPFHGRGLYEVLALFILTL
jgi:hypothetical protein